MPVRKSFKSSALAERRNYSTGKKNRGLYRGGATAGANANTSIVMAKRSSSLSPVPPSFLALTK